MNGLTRYCRQLFVTNNGNFFASISCVNSNTQTEHILEPQIYPTMQMFFDLTLVDWIKNGDMVSASSYFQFQVKVISDAGNSPESTDPTWLTFNKDSNDQAMYTAAGDDKIPTISFQKLGPNQNCRQITVSNEGTYPAVISAANETTMVSNVMDPEVQAGAKNVVFDLTKVDWLKTGDTFRPTLFIASSGLQVRNSTRVMFNKDSKNKAVYVAGGGPDSPTFTFKEVCPIVGPIGPGKRIFVVLDDDDRGRCYSLLTTVFEILSPIPIPIRKTELER
ncbi:hypothetical protein BDP27DRAFT_1417947 [Rhodocollybia butyracea]|uniref:Uncharacterized protein n=1 Tax=Rhodocollybia butyracea TaxID=206335 RepID=A0A9P5Q1W5_9AGAR|nr:hypothetical protein BDP27DRAFT_1417947 [Rhodocollybia butyracea]